MFDAYGPMSPETDVNIATEYAYSQRALQLLLDLVGGEAKMKDELPFTWSPGPDEFNTPGVEVCTPHGDLHSQHRDKGF